MMESRPREVKLGSNSEIVEARTGEEPEGGGVNWVGSRSVVEVTRILDGEEPSWRGAEWALS